MPTKFMLTLSAMVMVGLASSPVSAAPDKTIQIITPVFAQLVDYSVPSNFVPAFEDSKAEQYIQELLPKGQTLESWSQMVTLTGIKGLASNPNATPDALALRIGEAFQKTCPESFQGTTLGPVKVSGRDGFALVASCGTTVRNAKQSESALLVVIKGDADFYTLQWAERGKASKTPIPFDEAKWVGRIKTLTPKLCAKVEGEKPPFPSCTGSK